MDVPRVPVLRVEQLPVPFGDDFDGVLGHFDGGLIVELRIPDPGYQAAQLSASAMVLPGTPSGFTCGQIEKSTTPSVSSLSVGGFHSTKSSPIRGVITMLPALSPTQTISRSDGRRSASPDSRIQWHR